jgi:hypothetical protein
MREEKVYSAGDETNFVVYSLCIYSCTYVYMYMCPALQDIICTTVTVIEALGFNHFLIIQRTYESNALFPEINIPSASRTNSLRVHQSAERR